jgi:hypothetical protein
VDVVVASATATATTVMIDQSFDRVYNLWVLPLINVFLATIISFIFIFIHMSLEQQ